VWDGGVEREGGDIVGVLGGVEVHGCAGFADVPEVGVPSNNDRHKVHKVGERLEIYHGQKVVG
jgi:hypothetical protein